MSGAPVNFEAEALYQACCVCGEHMESNPSNMCVRCLEKEVSVVEGLQTEYSLTWCKLCDRYLVPPAIWTFAPLESKELMAICLKKIKGLQARKGLRLVDANFLFTEPHSRRLKIKLTVEREVFKGQMAVQMTVVTYIVNTFVCPQCNANMTQDGGGWAANLQLRQRAPHKRTFLWLEQVIIKARMHAEATRIATANDGIDFYFGNRQGVAKLLNFLQSVITVKVTESERIVSMDTKSNTANIQYSTMVELPPLCRDDLVILPPEISRDLGGMGPLVLIRKVAASILVVDPVTGRAGSIPGAVYWKHPFNAVAQAVKRNLSQFVVLDVIDEGDYASTKGGASTRGRGSSYPDAATSIAPTDRTAATTAMGSRRIVGRRAALSLAEESARRGTAAELIVTREDTMDIDQAVTVRSHLVTRVAPTDMEKTAGNGEESARGFPLGAGSHVMGYDLRSLQLSPQHDRWMPKQLPEVVLVHRYYPKQASRRGRRVWALRRMDMDGRLEDADDLEEFLDDIERDPFLRKDVELYYQAPVEGAADDTATAGGESAVPSSFAAPLSKKQRRMLQRQAVDQGFDAPNMTSAGGRARAAGQFDDGHETEDDADDTPFIDSSELLRDDDPSTRADSTLTGGAMRAPGIGGGKRRPAPTADDRARDIEEALS